MSGEMKLMRVSVPSDTEDRDQRLAANLAVLFGVESGVPDDRPTWVARLDALTLTELGDGGPNPPSEKRGRKSADSPAAPIPAGEIVPDAFRQFHPVTPATLNRFRPDRKSGAILDGARTLFEPLLPTFDDVLRIVAIDDAGEWIAEEIRIAIWGLLVLETYRSQPALFMSAVTARRIQRALGTAAAPYIPSNVVTNHIERDNPPSNEIRETALDILDETIRVFTAKTENRDGRAHPLGDDSEELEEPRRTEVGGVTNDDESSPSNDHAGGEPAEDEETSGESGSSEYLREDLIERWLKHIMESDDRGFTWVVAEGDQHRVEAFTSPLASLNAFVDEVAPVSRFPDAERFFPRIPSAAELRRYPDAQRVTIWVVLQIHRLLRDNGRYNAPSSELDQFQLRVTRDALRLADLAAELLPATDPLVPWTRAKALSKQIVDTRETDPDAAGETLDELRAQIDLMKALHEGGVIDPGAMADFLHSFTSIVTAIGADADHLGQARRAQDIFRDLADDWSLFFRLLDVTPSALLEKDVPVNERRRARLLATHLHNYVNSLLHSSELEDRRLALRLERELVVPARRRLSAARQSDSALRLALQTEIRAAIALEAVSAEDAPACVQAVLGATSALIETRSGSIALYAGETGRTLRSGQINALTAMVAGVELAARHGRSVKGMTTDQAIALAQRADAALLVKSGGRESGRLRQLRATVTSLTAAAS